MGEALGLPYDPPGLGRGYVPSARPQRSESRHEGVLELRRDFMIALVPAVENAMPIQVCHPEEEMDPFPQDKLAPLSGATGGSQCRKPPGEMGGEPRTDRMGSST